LAQSTSLRFQNLGLFKRFENTGLSKSTLKMATTRKPKKVLIQFGVALVIAVALGVGAIVIGFTIISSISSQADKARQDAQQKSVALQAELEKVKTQQEMHVARTYKMVQALVDIQPGQPITRDMVTLVESEEHPGPGSLNMMSQAVGKMVKSPILQGEALDTSRMIDASGYINVQAGMRAITIQVDNIAALNGSLAPGARVDVLTTLANDEKTLTRTMLQNVQVIAVGDSGAGAAAPSLGRNADNGGAASAGAKSAGGAVTLVVTPKQAEMLTLASQLGQFHLTLRNFQDKKMDPSAGTDITQLLTGVDPSATLNRKLPDAHTNRAADGFHNVNYAPDANLPGPGTGFAGKSKFSMQIYRGTGSETVEFEK
jgi:pilus assembly protein CpaB